MQPISAFVLTFNSEKYLDRILEKLCVACDEVLIVDSGSWDSTRSIADKYGCRFLFRALDDFKSQRSFATSACAHNLVVMVDSDEIPDEALVGALKELRNSNGHLDAYRIRREWVVLGKKVHAVYPIVSPDFPIRLFDKRICGFEKSNVVHEEPSGYKSIGILNGTLRHITFETKEEIADKLDRYSSLSAQTLLDKKKSTGILQQWMSSFAAFIKWYIIMGGWKDGKTGITLAKYAYDYTFLKYKKARVYSSRHS